MQCPLSPVSSDLLCFHWSKLEQNYAHRIPCLICKSKIAFSPFVAVTVLKYALRHINKNTTVHFLWYWILCISLQFKRNFDFDFTDTLMLYQRQRAPCLLYIDLTMIKKNTCGSRIIYTWAFIKRHNIGFFFFFQNRCFSCFQSNTVILCWSFRVWMSISQLNVRYVFHFHLNFSTVAMKHKFLLPSPYCWVLVTTIFVPVYVNSFHLNVTGGQFRPFVWSKPVVICSAETSSVEDIITITIIFQTTAFARTCTVFVDFVV